MFLLLLVLFVVKNMWNKEDGEWISLCSQKNGGGHIFPQKKKMLLKTVEAGC